MTKIRIGLALLFCGFIPAFAQIDALALRDKYGAPLDRETFNVRPGIEMIVDYGPGKQVCRIQLPSGIRIAGTAPPGTITKQQIEEVLNEVVPPAIRGKGGNRSMSALGAPMFFLDEYEHVTITELRVGGVGKGVTVTFKDSSCPMRTAP